MIGWVWSGEVAAHLSQPVYRSRIMTGLRFFFRVTLQRLDPAGQIYQIGKPRKIRLVMSRRNARLPAVASNSKVRTMLSLLRQKHHKERHPIPASRFLAVRRCFILVPRSPMNRICGTGVSRAAIGRASPPPQPSPIKDEGFRKCCRPAHEGEVRPLQHTVKARGSECHRALRIAVRHRRKWRRDVAVQTKIALPVCGETTDN
jgi:hypothetical protein